MNDRIDLTDGGDRARALRSCLLDLEPDPGPYAGSGSRWSALACLIQRAAELQGGGVRRPAREQPSDDGSTETPAVVLPRVR